MSSTGQFHYEIVITYNGRYWRDINYCIFLRNPIYKLSSYCLLKGFLPQLAVYEILNRVGEDDFPTIIVEIYRINEPDEEKGRTLLFSKDLLCLSITPDGELLYEETNTHATMLLVHPILYYLDNHNTFNKYFIDTTAYDVISNFESWLKSKHGDIFNINHQGVFNYKNSFEYEQILVRAPSDLNVPIYLTNVYKAIQANCFYFYDPFEITIENDKEIRIHFLTTQNKNSLQTDDINEYYDKGMSLKLLSEHPFNDISRELVDKDQNGHRKVFNHRNILYDHEKKPTQTTLQKMTMSNVMDIKLVQETERKIKFPIATNSGSSQETSSSISRFYVPDKVSCAEERFSLGQEYYKNVVDGFSVFEFSNCLPDFPKFGNRYNLDTFNPREYIFTPLSICNIYARKIQREQYLYHFSKCLMLKYK